MSRQNVESVQSAILAFNRQDLEFMLDWLAPDVEMHVSDAFVDEPQTIHGHDGFRAFLTALGEIFETFSVEPEEFVDADDRVLAIVRAGGIGRQSGVETYGRFGHVWTLRDLQGQRFTEYKDVDEALEAVRGAE
jgi:ketosteroid isomerase-like protein